jgi:Putative adhesin
MPVFETPEPIFVQIELPVGDVWLKAGDRTDTVVDVSPRHRSSKADVNSAEQTRVEYADGRLLVKAPQNWRRYSFFGPGSSVDVVIELPSGSSIQAEAGWTTFRCDGQLGEARFNSGGDIRLEQTGALDVETSHGHVTVERVVGRARITTSSGSVRLRTVDGPVEIKNSSGECWIGEATGDVRVNTASGDITVDRALASVSARTAYGAIRIGEIARGSAALQGSYGAIEVGIHKGSAAWLDVASSHGRVRNALEATDAPSPADETVEVRASTSYGDITIRRS